MTAGVYRGAFVLALLVGLALLGLQLKWVLLQLFAAAIVAAGMAPVVRRSTDVPQPWLGNRRPPKGLVVALIYAMVGLVVLVLGTILLQVVLVQGGLLLERVPAFALAVQDWYAGLSRRSPLLAQLNLFDLLGGVSGLTGWATGVLRQVLNVATVLLALFGGALNVLFVLFMALYLTVDGATMRDYLLVFLPRDRQAQARRVLTDISLRLGHWVVGELTLCLIVGVAAGIGFALLGVPGAALLGVVWAVAELIPGIGPFVAAAPSIALGFVGGPSTGIIATIFTFLFSQVENNILVPRVMGHAVKLNPLVVLLALLVGNELLGLAGALFAIPLAAAAAVIVDELRRERLIQLEAASLVPTQTRDGSQPEQSAAVIG
ncbi:MAG: AI-2E family transporter [Chloroflexi bacterium]|nr:AI-2E family transporter [Chloroflexota bacterium]